MAMKLGLKLSFLVYGANVVFLIATGLVFQFATELFPFHSDVIETKWEDVDPNSQILYLGMMRTEAAGFLSAGVALGVLMFVALQRNELWLFLTMSTVGIVEYLPTFFANYHVSQVTRASPPWELMLSLILSLFLAAILSVVSTRNLKNVNGNR